MSNSREDAQLLYIEIEKILERMREQRLFNRNVSEAFEDYLSHQCTILDEILLKIGKVKKVKNGKTLEVD